MIGWLPTFVGRALRARRAGLEKTLVHAVALGGVPSSIVVTSADFEHGGRLAERHSADGEGLSPDLAWTGLPESTRSVLVLVEDADSPTAVPIVHLIAYGLAGCDGRLETGAIGGRARSAPFHVGRHDLLGRGWAPPDPPPGHGPHRYVFQVYALDRALAEDEADTRRKALAIVQQHALAKGAIAGTYERV